MVLTLYSTLAWVVSLEEFLKTKLEILATLNLARYVCIYQAFLIYLRVALMW